VVEKVQDNQLTQDQLVQVRQVEVEVEIVHLFQMQHTQVILRQLVHHRVILEEIHTQVVLLQQKYQAVEEQSQLLSQRVCGQVVVVQKQIFQDLQ
tara:strand:+ start:150 stop:434 length:285 start_codon:yes stop_codon:yes gene_type:complete